VKGCMAKIVPNYSAFRVVNNGASAANPSGAISAQARVTTVFFIPGFQIRAVHRVLREIGRAVTRKVDFAALNPADFEGPVRTRSASASPLLAGLLEDRLNCRSFFLRTSFPRFRSNEHGDTSAISSR
jgi:hypothetical protein